MNASKAGSANVGRPQRASGGWRRPASRGSRRLRAVADQCAGPFTPECDCAVVRLNKGALATSCVGGRRWRRGERALHHLIDPRTGTSADSNLHSVTVHASDAMTADVAAKVVLVLGREAGTAYLLQRGLSARLTATDGREMVAFGQVAAWLCLLLIASFHVRRHIGGRAWRRLHYASFVAFWLAVAHGLLLGTERTTVWANTLYMMTVSIVTFLTFYRILVTTRVHAMLVGGHGAQFQPAKSLRAV